MSMFSRSTGTAGGYQTGMNGTMEPGVALDGQEAPVLEAVHLRKVFPLRRVNLFGPARGVKAVEDVSLALRPGRSTALVGESGSGKTTVARLLARLYGITSGEIRFQGQVVDGKTSGACASIAAMCS